MVVDHLPLPTLTAVDVGDAVPAMRPGRAHRAGIAVGHTVSTPHRTDRMLAEPRLLLPWDDLLKRSQGENYMPELREPWTVAEALGSETEASKPRQRPKMPATRSLLTIFPPLTPMIVQFALAPLTVAAPSAQVIGAGRRLYQPLTPIIANSVGRTLGSCPCRSGI